MRVDGEIPVVRVSVDIPTNDMGVALTRFEQMNPTATPRFIDGEYLVGRCSKCNRPVILPKWHQMKDLPDDENGEKMCMNGCKKPGAR